MLAARIVVLADRPDRGRVLADAVSPLAGCRVAGTEETWAGLDIVQGVIADLSLDRTETRRCLAALADRLDGRRMPLIYLARTRADAVLREARRLGATACLSALTEPATVATALFRQIAPERTLTELLVEHSVARTGALFADMFADARSGCLDLDPVDEGVDPVLRAVQEGGLRHWLDLVQAHDDTTVRHCLLVAGLVAHFAVSLGLSREDRTALVRAGLVHDVGKARIPLAILNKPGPLDADEMAVMRTHAALGHEILVASGMTDRLALAVTRHHHEMLDGSGYPDGLRGDLIGDAVRLLTICDIYAALTEHRPYRPAMPQSDALRILRGMAGGRLEPALVEAFAASLAAGQPLQAAAPPTCPPERPGTPGGALWARPVPVEHTAPYRRVGRGKDV